MPQLLVMRHAKSAWDTEHADFDRPLASRGHKAAERMASWLDDNGLAPDQVVTSAAERAQRTAAYIVDHFDLADALECRLGLYGAAASTWLAVAAEQRCERLLIVGHNPGLDDLVRRLAPGAMPNAGGKLMTTAAIAVFTLADGWGGLAEPLGAPTSVCTLDQIVRPRELA